MLYGDAMRSEWRNGKREKWRRTKRGNAAQMRDKEKIEIVHLADVGSRRLRVAESATRERGRN